MEHFDDIFKKKLEHYDSGKPEHLWEGIQQELKQQTVSPFSKWIWAYVSSGVLVVAGITGYFLYHQQYKNAPDSSQIAAMQQELNQNNTAPESAISTAPEGQTASTSGQELVSTNPANRATTTSAADLSNSGKAMPQRHAKHSSSKTHATAKNSVADNTAATVAPPRFNWDWNPDIDAIVKAMEDEEKAKEKTKTVNTPAKKVAEATAPAVEKAAPSTPGAKQENTLSRGLVNGLAILPAAEERIPTSAELNLEMCYSFKGGCEHLYFEPYVAADYTSVAFKPRNGESKDYMNARINSEKPMLSPALGARLSLVSCGGLALRAGFSYQSNIFKFNYADQNATRNSTINILVDTIFPSPGDTIFVWDTLSIVQHGTLLKKTFNHFRSIDIPILAGYELETYKWIFSVNGGAIFNIVSWQKGDILNPELDPVSVTSGNDNNYKAFKTNTGISLTANLGFYYKLPNHAQLMFEPYFRYPLKSVTLDEYPLEEKHLTGGIRVGLRLPLGR